MKKFVVILCYVTIVAAILWSAFAIGNGKVGTFFGTDVFIASKDDMMAALVLNIVAALGLLLLGTIRLATRNRS